MSDNWPLVTICIPIYNGAQFLGPAIESALAQDYPNLEVLVVDDGSRDGSVDIATRYKQGDDRLRIVQNEENLGLVGNWNRCLELARGKYIKFHFQDDLMRPECVSKMVDAAVSSACALVLAGRDYLFEEGMEHRRQYYEQDLRKLSDSYSSSSKISSEELSEMFIRDYLGQNFLGEPIAGLFSKRVLERYGNFDSRLKQICDFEFWLRIGLNEPVFFLNESLLSFRVHGAATTQRNRSRSKKIPTSFSDRLILHELLLESSPYARFRGYCKEREVDPKQAFKGPFTSMVNSAGLVRTWRSFSLASIFASYSFSPLNLARLIYSTLRSL